MKKIRIIFNFRRRSSVHVVGVNTLQYIKYLYGEKKNKIKQKTKILAETTNKKGSKKQTKISHYLEVEHNSEFYWILKKLPLQIKGNANLKRNLFL